VNDETCVNAEEALKRIDAAVTWPLFGGLCHQLTGIAGSVTIPPCAAGSSEGCGLPADDAEVRPVHLLLRAVAVMASAIVQRPLAKASQRARLNDPFAAKPNRTCPHGGSPGTRHPRLHRPRLQERHPNRSKSACRIRGPTP